MTAKKTALQEAAARLMEAITEEAVAHKPKAEALLRALAEPKGDGKS